MRRFTMFFTLIITAFLLAACGPARYDCYEEVAPNETAFVIPLEGNTGAQKKMMSVEYLNSNKVATKRIYIPLKKVSTGRWWWEYKWVPTIQIIKVDRSPITFEWDKDTALKVESKDSIGFKVGTNIAAFIAEPNTATFLYYYPSGNLKAVLQKEIKSRANEALSKKFAEYDLEGAPAVYDKGGKLVTPAQDGARALKGSIVAETKREVVEYFKTKGVTITTFGLVGGLRYEDEAIQVAINKNFESELEIKNRHNELLAQKDINEKELSKAKNDRRKAEEFAKAAKARTEQINLEVKLIKAKAHLVMAKTWDGSLPANMMPAGANFMFSMPTH